MEAGHLRAVVVDDEQLAREEVCFLLGEMGLRASHCRPPFAQLTAAEHSELKIRAATLKSLEQQ